MAILKEKTLPNGAVGNYWRVMSITLNRQTFTANATLGLFKDQATSNAGAPPLNLIKPFNFTWQPSDLDSDNVVGLFYTKIIAKASAMVSKDLSGADIEPRAFDPDIAGGTSV